MRPDVVERRLNSLPNLSRQGKPINGLFRLLIGSDHIWEKAYNAIASNKGALTVGVDPANTLDGFSIKRIATIRAKLADGTYRFSPVRRVEIPKPDGRMRPLGIPTADDKLVQAAVKIVLEQVYEPIFSDRSHGFRKGRSCHSALTEVRGMWKGVKWLVKVDVVGFFDNIDHATLLDLLKVRIADPSLLRLVKPMLDAGYMENWTWMPTFSGTPQGGVISPLLANIYLHELDRFMERLKVGFDLGKSRRHHHEYHRLSSLIGKRRRKASLMTKCGASSDEVQAILREAEELDVERRKYPATEPFDRDFRRVLYCRYADDFLIGVVGSKDDARSVFEQVGTFLREHLKLEVSDAKSGIHKADEGVEFLGYTVRTYSADFRRAIRRRGKAVMVNVVTDVVQLHVPKHKLIRFAEKHRLGNFSVVKGTMRPELVNSSDAEILMGYNSLLRGLAEFYKLGTLWKKQISPLSHIWWFSLMKTLARKHKTSIRDVINRLLTKHGNELGIEFVAKDGSKRLIKVARLRHIQPMTIPYGRNPEAEPSRPNVDVEPSTAFNPNRNDLLDRLKAGTCEACGNAESPVEVHHVRKLADMGNLSLFTFLRMARTRKRVVLCHPCHVAHHSGRLKARLDRLGHRTTIEDTSAGAV
jgi:group II intron reverse transcriptase/maturase